MTTIIDTFSHADFIVLCPQKSKFINMADDRDVLRAVWDGRVPAAFTLSPFEVETLTAPPPFYLMLPRQSYITVCTDKVRISNYDNDIQTRVAETTIKFRFFHWSPTDRFP